MCPVCRLDRLDRFDRRGCDDVTSVGIEAGFEAGGRASVNFGNKITFIIHDKL